MTTARNDSYGFLSGGGSPSAKFTTYGDTVGGVITEEPQVQQQTDIKDGTPLVWQDGSPRMQMVVTVQTQLRDPAIDEDDGKRRIFVRGQMRNAVQQAVIAAGAKGLDVGGTLNITYVADGERKNPAFNPPKIYQASYTPPAADGGAGFLGTTTQAAPAAAQPAPTAAPTPAPAGGTALPPGLPPTITPEVWATLTPEAQAALLVTSSAK